MEDATPPRKRPKRDYERAATARAFQAARLARDAGISFPEAAKRCDAKPSSVAEAFTALTCATAEEVARIEAGEASLSKIARESARRVPVEIRKANRKANPTLSREIIQGREFDAAVWGKLRDAFDALAALPQPADVIGVVKKNPMRIDHVNRKLMTAFGWITEFSDAWTK